MKCKICNREMYGYCSKFHRELAPEWLLKMEKS